MTKKAKFIQAAKFLAAQQTPYNINGLVEVHRKPFEIYGLSGAKFSVKTCIYRDKKFVKDHWVKVYGLLRIEYCHKVKLSKLVL